MLKNNSGNVREKLTIIVDSVFFVRSATVFGQSMHLLVDENVRRDEIDQKLHSVGIGHTEIHEIGPSLEDVFVTLSAKYATEEEKEKAA